MSLASFPSYAELHAHSNYSFLDGVSDPEELVEEGVRLGLSALALTDHNGFYGVVKFAQAAAAAGLPALYGVELTLESLAGRSGVLDPQGSHLVVLAKNPSGYVLLSSLITKGHMSTGKKGSFSLTFEDLSEVATGDLVILSGCRKGAISQVLMRDGPQEASKVLSHLVDLFSRTNFFVECWDHGDPIDTARNEALIALAVRNRVGCVATGNVHYATQNSGQLAHVVSAVRSSKPLREMDGWLGASHSAYLRSPAEQHRRFARFPGLVETSVEIGRECTFDLRLVSPCLPDFAEAKGVSEIQFLRQLVEVQAPARYGSRSQERISGAYRQIDHELNIIDELGFAGYFLVVWDIVEFCRFKNILCQGRGSAANSAVCYSIGITNCDPVSLRLLFERFLSPERDGPPDIDVDIESGRREEVIQYVYEKYGRERAAQVANVISYRSRSAVREVAKAFGYSGPLVDKWAKQVERYGSLTAALQLKDPDGSAVVEVPPEVARFATELEHKPRHLGLHPGGMVICDRPIFQVCPVEWARSKDRSVLQWDKEDCAQIGLVKFDLLGLGILSALHEACDLVREFHGVDVDLALIPQEDAVYEMLCRADSVGVFQVESRAQMATLPRLKPRHFYDLVVEVALIRPGPIQGGSVHPYIRRRNGLEEVTYLHPLLENALSKTLGVPLFQEQLMQMAIDVAGFSAAEADQLRQAMGSKRSAAKMQHLKARLYQGMAERGITGPTAEEIFNKLAAFANFGFPESHSASFAYLVYASAWFKLYYPAAFCAALLRSQPMGFWSPNTLVGDARRHGVQVFGPEVGISRAAASLEWMPRAKNEGQVPLTLYGKRGPAVRLGLDSIRGVGKELAQEIWKVGPYLNLEELTQRVNLNEAHLISLAKAGALSQLGGGLSRRQAMWLAGPLAKRRENELEGLAKSGAPPIFKEPTQAQRYALDLFSTGVIPDGHPLEILRSKLSQEGFVSSGTLPQLENNSVIKIGGVVTHRQRPHTAKGITFINLEDEEGLVNVICSKEIWARYRRAARSANGLMVTGRLEHFDGVINVIALEIEELAPVRAWKSRDFR